MSWFRQTLRANRAFILTVLTVNVFYMVEGTRFVYAYQVHEQNKARLKEISEFLNIPVERLRPDHEGLFDSIRKLFVDEVDPVKAAGLKRLQEVLRKHEEQVASHPYLPRIEEVKREHAVSRIEGVIRDLMQLTRPPGGKALPEPSQRAILRNLHHALREDLTLPLPEGLPARTQTKHAEMQAKLDRLFDTVRPVVAETQGEMKGTLAQKIAKLSALQEVETRRPSRPPRFADRPLPLRRVERKVRSEEVSADGAKPSRRVSAKGTVPTPLEVVSKDAVAPELIELAESLGNVPARILAYVHDNIEFDPKWGAAKPPLATLWEKSGTSWEQAWLLRDLLTAAGVDARFEWGEIEVPTELITNMTGLDDPWRAGDLLTTAGMPIVLLTQGGEVVGARMSHVWVNAWVDYIPNRGATSGPGDYWIWMGPSLKRYAYTEGTPAHEQVPFSLEEYLQSGTTLSPRRAYEEALWAHIRANDLNCTTLEQLKQAPSVIREDFPFLPGTLRGKILQIDGQSTEVPDGFQQTVRLEMRAAGGVSLLVWESPLPAVFGGRVEVAWQGATADDQATIASYGGVFETPPYLVDLKPVLKVSGSEQIAGGAIGSAEDVEIFVTVTTVGGGAELFVHTGYAGEPSVLVNDFGRVSEQVLSAHQEAHRMALEAGDPAAVEVAALQLLGTTYLDNLGRDLEDLAGWNQHRLVGLGTEALIAQTGTVATTAGGSPLSFTRAETFIDAAGMLVGLFHTGGQTSFLKPTMELAGAQGSFLEGEVFNQVVEREGIAAVSALTRARRAGQALTRVDGSNVDAVLAGVDLGEDVEAGVRSAVGNGRIAWVSESPIDVHQWHGTGYVLEDPSTGAAAYLLSGGYAGGVDTGGALEKLQDLLGSEPWLEAGPLGELLRLLVEMLGGGGAGSGGDGPATNQSDPINLSTGNLWFTETDLTIQARGLPILWSRTYNSRSRYTGPLGHGWTFSYDERMEEQPDGSVLYREADGTEHTFAADGSGGYTAPAGKHLTLVKGLSNFTLQTRNELVSTFDLDGHLLSVADRNGNTIGLSYDAERHLSSVSDAAGRTVLNVTTDAGKITRLTDFTGRTVIFAYTGNDLTAVTDTVGHTLSYRYDADHNLIARSDPLGNTDSYFYDAHDRCAAHVDPLGHQESFRYPSRGSRAVLTDRRGFDSYFEFDGNGRAVLEVDPLGNASRSTWDDDHNRTSTTDPRGGVTSRTFDDRGNLLSETNALDQTTTFTYDPVHNEVLTTTDATGHRVTNVYDGNGNLTETRQVVSGETLTQSNSYDAFGQLETRTDAKGHATTFGWDATKGSLESQTDPMIHTTEFTTGALGRVAAITDPEDNLVSLGWDDRDRIVSAIDPFGNTSAITYDEAGRQTEVITPHGTTLTEYDAAGRSTAITDVVGNTTRTEYDPAGNPIVQIDAKGNRTTTYYDAIGRPVAVIDALGNVWIYGHCAEIAGGGTGCTTGCAGGGAAAPGMGSFCELTDPLGNLTRQDFDALGRVERVTDPLGHQTTIAYDAAGRREAVTGALGRTTRYEYDVQGRLTAVIEANGARTEYSYDGNGNMTNMKDAEGRDWPRTYDEMNRLKTESDPLGNTTQYFYDALGNLERKTKPDGQEITYDYDLRRLIAVNLPGAAVESFGYDTLGRRTSMANAEVALSYMFDELNRLTQTTNHTLTQSIGYEYDDNNNLTRMIGPRGAVEYFYDELNRLVEQRDPVTGVFLYEYDNLGRRTALHYPNGLTTEYSYGVASRLESIITRNEQGEVVDGYSYSYDPVGNRLTMIGLHDGVRHEYEYDEVYRLSRWNRGPSRFEAYTYDNVGNRATLTDEAGSITYDYDLANRLVSEVRQFTDGTGVDTIYAWDANGNLTTKTAGSVVTVYQWDALDRMVGLTGPGGANSYGYDPEGIRFRETNNGETENFLLAKDTHGFGDIVAVFHGSGALSTYFTHGMGVDEPLAQVNGQGMHYLHRDGLGSVTALSGTDGYISGAMSYAAFGDVEDQVGMGSRHGYTSRELDATELMYYRTRYYQPRVGRFASRESFRGSPLVPASLHDYQYVFNNPIIHGDPTGQQPLRLWPAIAKAVEYLMRFLYMRLAKAVPITNVPHGWSQGMFFAGIAVGLGICGFFTSTSEDAAYYRNWAFGLALMLVSIAFMTSVLILAGQLKYSMHAAYRILVTSMFFFGWALGCHVVYVWREQRK